MSNKPGQILGHGADNDGIEEYDNPLPTWWLGLFYFTIGWAIFYGVNYHFVAKTSQAAQYDAEVAAAEAAMPVKTTQLPTEPTAELAAAGKEIFATNCVACHGPEAKGVDAAGNKTVGPNLTDSEWIHGGTYADIQKTITNGVPEKGMITWGPILGPEKIAKVAAFVHASGGGQ